MRTVFVFPASDRVATVAALDRHLSRHGDAWSLDGALYVDVDDERTGLLFSDWDPDDVAVLETDLGHRPEWAVQADISGRVDGTAEIRRLVELLLEHGGRAVDDYSAHPWTLEEIESGAVVGGLRFFDFRAVRQPGRGSATP
ncbi:hypothetical protein ACFWTE_20490 [Nocardiopsis sp. NPDC058631]|uniref:hypothetical protein n=1 Tax=Nocardiopsis sp. NPDC058631 TaxID=3346566 RepID=UPI00364E0858